MTKTKHIQEKQQETKADLKVEIHYRLTHQEFLIWIENYNLKWSEVKLYLYFCTLNPFGDQDIEFSPAKVYSQLKIQKSAFYSAAARLEELGLLNLKVSKAKVRINPINRTNFHLNGKSSTKTESIPVERKEVHHNGSASKQSENQPPEPLQHNDSSTPHTIQTYTDFKKTLSLEARESFEKFVREEYFKREGKKIRSFSAFMSDDHFQEWYQDYQNRPEALVLTQNAKWENHPHCEEWVAEIEKSGNPLMFAGRDKEKQEFVKWANENKLFSWFKEE